MRMRDVLNWTNRARGYLGLKPLKRLPKGIQEDPYACPIGKALQGLVEVPSEDDSAVIVIPVNDKVSVTLKTSKAVDDFIGAFDAGDIPELIAE